MSDTTFDVRIWKTEIYRGKRKTTHTVRWSVAGRPWRDTFATAAMADSFRSELLTATRKGQAFDVATGRPMLQKSGRKEMTWYDFACAYVDMKWPESAGKSRAGVADTLATLTPALLSDASGRPPKALRLALYTWAFNARARAAGPAPSDYRAAIEWASANTRNVSALDDPATVRQVLRSISRKIDGKVAATSTISRKRAVLFNALEYAVELKLLDRNPLTSIPKKRNARTEAIDPRTVINHAQAVQLLDAVRNQKNSAAKLVAFFGLLYYCALRPAEAAGLTKNALQLPDAADEWGQIFLNGSAPTTGAAWSDNGSRRDHRSLKHRAREEIRIVPCPPPMVELLRAHLDQFGARPDGRLFAGARGGDLSESLYGRVWQMARETALTPSEAASPLAQRPYDLRHAAVSTWLAAGVPATQVAEWAGHGLAVLLRVYAKCIAGQEGAALDRISTALGVA